MALTKEAREKAAAAAAAAKSEKETATPPTPETIEEKTDFEKEVEAFEFEDVDNGDFTFHTMKDVGDTFTGILLEDLVETNNPKYQNDTKGEAFEGILAEEKPSGNTVILSRHYGVLKFLKNNYVAGKVCRITISGIAKGKGQGGTDVKQFKFQLAK